MTEPILGQPTERVVRPVRHINAARLTLLALVVGLPAAAQAEVMDKEGVPWSPGYLIAAAFVLTICLLSVRFERNWSGTSWRWLPLASGLLVALLWALVGLANDYFDHCIGPLMRAEMTTTENLAFPLALGIAHLSPFMLLAVPAITRRNRSPGHNGG